MTIDELKEKAAEIRETVLDIVYRAKAGHIGGDLSVADIMTALFFSVLRADPQHPDDPERDRFVLSKGHAAEVYYACLAKKGYFPVSELMTLNQGGTKLPSHVDMLKTPGIDFTAGSLGQGFSAALGIAAAQRLQGYSGSYTYAIVGDGESQEGQIWEAAECAGAWGVDNLIAFTDVNGQQLDGYTEDIIPMHHLKQRYETFGFDAYEINGHDFNAIADAVASAKKVKGKPHMIILNTIKSYGYIPGEGIKSNHSMSINEETRKSSIEALIKREEAGE